MTPETRRSSTRCQYDDGTPCGRRATMWFLLPDRHARLFGVRVMAFCRRHGRRPHMASWDRMTGEEFLAAEVLSG